MVSSPGALDKAALVPQAAQNSLNPVLRVQDQVAEPLLTHGKAKDKDRAYDRVAEVFGLVGLAHGLHDPLPL